MSGSIRETTSTLFTWVQSFGEGTYIKISVEGSGFEFDPETDSPTAGTVSRVTVNAQSTGGETPSYRLSNFNDQTVEGLNALAADWYTSDSIWLLPSIMDGLVTTLFASSDFYYGAGANSGDYFADVIYGLSGNDTIYGAEGDDEVYGGTGDDAIFGGAHNDVLSGSAGHDTIYGDHNGSSYLDGADNINGGSGNDYVVGGGGNDTIKGASDNDTLFGGDNDDDIHGGSGADDVEGQAGNDTLTGGSGNDFLDGGDDDDDINGNAGNDYIVDGAGNDRATGSAGNDTVISGFGDDQIKGNDGNDKMLGLAGSDNVWGNAGADTFAFFPANGLEGHMKIRDFDASEDYLNIFIASDKTSTNQYALFEAGAVQNGDDIRWTSEDGKFSVTIYDAMLTDISADDFASGWILDNLA